MMTEDFTYNLRVISTLSILIPLIANLFALRKTASKRMLFFFLFLIIGFVSDLSGWYLAVQAGKCTDQECKEMIYNIMYVRRYFYALIEGIFFVWFINMQATGNVLKKLTHIAIWITALFWIMCIPISKVILNQTYLTLFDTTHSVLASFLASFVLIQILEGEKQIIYSPYFWLTFAIFFYSFSTFFILSLIKSQLGLDLWFLHNYINITTYILYTLGFIFFEQSDDIG